MPQAPVPASFASPQGEVETLNADMIADVDVRGHPIAPSPKSLIPPRTRLLRSFSRSQSAPSDRMRTQFDGVATIGIDEHCCAHTAISTTSANRPTRLLGIIPVRLADVFANWLKDQPFAFSCSIYYHVASSSFAEFRRVGTEIVFDAASAVDPAHVVSHVK